MKTSLKDELKIVLKIAKLEYFVKAIISILLRAILLVIPILFSMAVNSITNGDKKTTIIMLVISIVLAGLYRFFEGYNQVAYYKLYNKIFDYYNNEAIKNTKDNSMFSLSRFSPGQYTNIVISDVDIMSGFFSSLVLRIVQLIEFLIIFIYFYTIDIYVFLATLVITIIMLVIALKLGDKVQTYNEIRKNKLDRFTSSSYEYFGSIKEIKSFNIFEKVYPFMGVRRKEYLDGNGEYNIKFNCYNSGILFVFELFRLLAVLYIAIKVINNNLEVGIILVIYNYYQKIIDNFLIVLTLNVESRNVKVSLERYNHIREYVSKKDNIIILKKESVKGEIVFNKLLYGFKKRPTLKNISFVIPSNSMTILSNGNESAQNGVFDLLLKLNRQHKGTITIDGTDIRDIEDNSYYSLISTVRRDNELFKVSIKDNLKMVEKNFDVIEELCEELGISEEINNLKDGYNTVIDDNTPLSVSTRKLLVVVRMILSEGKIVLIDDVISFLDSEHEKRLLKFLNKYKKDHTVLVITNSKNFIEKADKVLEINTDNVIEKKE